MSDESLPVGALLGATLRTWGRVLVPSVAWTALAWAPAITWIVLYGWGWPVVGLGLLADSLAWTLLAGRTLGALRGTRIGGLPTATARGLSPLRRLPLAFAAMVVVHAPVIALCFGSWEVLADRNWIYQLAAAIAPVVVGLLLAIELYGRWVIAVPVAVERGRWLGEAGRLTRPHRTTIHGVTIVIGVIWVGVAIVALMIASSMPGTMTGDDAAVALAGSWAALSTLRGAMAVAIYACIVDRWTAADLSSVFE